MNGLETLIIAFSQLPSSKRDREQITILKRAYAKEQGLSDVPSNMQLLKAYHGLLAAKQMEKDTQLEQLLRKRSIRSESGIVPIQVLTKPFWCPGKCIFCPNDATMPKSYINTQPGAMRALLNQFDPYKQVYNRLLSLTLTGHPTDKIEMIVLGGTRDVYPQRYKIQFIKGLYDACNTFSEFLSKIDIDFSNSKAARYTTTEGLNIVYPETVEESIQINETAGCRIIGMTVETRPEYVTDKNCQFRRGLGITRMEMGVQTLQNDVHEANKRGHDNEAIKLAMHKLRQYGFKISNHYMPGLYTSNLEKDIETFQIAFGSPWIKSDEMKFYPTAVIPNTELYDLYKKGEYTPLDNVTLETIIRRAKLEIIPPYARIKRLARDFDTNEVVAGANTPNLRQLVMNQMQQEMDANQHARSAQYMRLYPHCHQVTCYDDLLAMVSKPLDDSQEIHRGLDGTVWEWDDTVETFIVDGEVDITSPREFVCLCTRCREVRHKEEGTQSTASVFLVVRRYRSSVGQELFLSFEDGLGYLRGFTRLLLPDAGQAIDRSGLGEGTALIRELHVYGTLQRLTTDPADETTDGKKAQHSGIGTRLMQTAEAITQKNGYQNLSVIAGVGVRKYYEKLGYTLEGTYMVKTL